MMSMWTAPSDRDYYGEGPYEEEAERCASCGSVETQACEEWCNAERPDGPAPMAPYPESGLEDAA